MVRLVVERVKGIGIYVVGCIYVVIGIYVFKLGIVDIFVFFKNFEGNVSLF